MCRGASYLALTALALAAAACGSQRPYEGKSVAELEEMLADADPAVQAQGAHGLGLHGAEARTAVPALGGALGSPHVHVREAAARSLGQIGPEARSAVPAL